MNEQTQAPQTVQMTEEQIARLAQIAEQLDQNGEVLVQTPEVAGDEAKVVATPTVH